MQMFAVPTPKRSVVLRVAIVAACLSSAFSIAQNATEPAAQASVCTPATCAYLNPDLAPDVRAKDLVNRMTLEEKVSQTLDQAAAIPRLGVPQYGWWNEALHGVARYGSATMFPQAIGMAATWDTDLIRRIGGVIAVEGRAKYNDAVANGARDRFAGLTF